MIDDYSLKLGAIEEGLRHFRDLFAVVNDKLDKVIDSTAVINDKANKAHSRIDDILDDETGILTIAAANANDWIETKTRTKWIGTGLLGSGLLGGTVLGTWLTKIAAVFGGSAP